jgi:hypothetical protein
VAIRIHVPQYRIQWHLNTAIKYICGPSCGKSFTDASGESNFAIITVEDKASQSLLPI